MARSHTSSSFFWGVEWVAEVKRNEETKREGVAGEDEVDLDGPGSTWTLSLWEHGCSQRGGRRENCKVTRAWHVYAQRLDA